MHLILSLYHKPIFHEGEAERETNISCENDQPLDIQHVINSVSNRENANSLPKVLGTKKKPTHRLLSLDIDSPIVAAVEISV
jgi:hypothetical protein